MSDRISCFVHFYGETTWVIGRLFLESCRLVATRMVRVLESISIPEYVSEVQGPTSLPSAIGIARWLKAILASQVGFCLVVV